jgi:hypothetical protein
MHESDDAHPRRHALVAVPEFSTTPHAASKLAALPGRFQQIVSRQDDPTSFSVPSVTSVANAFNRSIRVRTTRPAHQRERNARPREPRPMARPGAGSRRNGISSDAGDRMVRSMILI